LERQNLSNRGPRVGTVAAHLGVTPRYLQMLFESSGESFSKFLLAERLEVARRVLLADPARPIGVVAFAAGFNDLSYFNRTFRRRLGGTPTDTRADALCRHNRR
jgi:AraC-like DNA-binding protein